MASTPPLERQHHSGAMLFKRARENVEDAEAEDDRRLGTAKNIPSTAFVQNMGILKRQAYFDPEPAYETVSKDLGSKHKAHRGNRCCDELGCQKLRVGASGKCKVSRRRPALR